MLYCTSTVHHPPSSQVVEFPLATACWAEGEEAQGRALCCILGWKLLSSVSEFLEKTFHCGSFFFFFPRGPSCAGELLSSCWLTTLSLGLEEAFSHLCVYPSLAAYCLVYEPLTLQSCTPVQRNHLVKRVSGQSCFDYSLASTGWVLAGWERKMRAAQEEGQSQQTSCRTNKPFIVFIIKFSFHTCMR